jgi:hypothetical protein
MKSVLLGCIFIACVLFVVGGVMSYYGKLDTGIYTLLSTVVSGVVGVISLVSLIRRPAVTAQDMKTVEVELVQGLADTMKEVNEYEAKLSSNREEIDRLQKERAEIELLVRQASLKVFMEEKAKRLSEEIERLVLSNAQLIELLNQYEDTIQQVAKVDGELITSGKAELIQNIVATLPARGSRRPVYLLVMGRKVDISPVIDFAESLAVSLTAAIVGGKANLRRRH